MTTTKLRPSGYWSLCPRYESDPTPSVYAERGTAAHDLARRCVETATEARDWIGRQMGNGLLVDVEMAELVDRSTQVVWDLFNDDDLLTIEVEKPLPIESVTAEPGATGTTDLIGYHQVDRTLIVFDHKFGRGVPVCAEGNTQLQIYALAGLDHFNLMYDIQRVKMVISQPALQSVSEVTLTLDELEAKRIEIRAAADLARDPNSAPIPGAKQCRWCAKKATCPALAETATADFEIVQPSTASDERLAEMMSKVDLIDIFTAAIRAETYKRLAMGASVHGWKLVQGRRGARQWRDKFGAEALMRSMRLRAEEMYVQAVISPTRAEKLAQDGTLGPKQWARLENLIVQPEGNPQLVPQNDSRPALAVSAVVDLFDDMTTSSNP